MASLFFYGTLRHVPLLELVLGRALEPGELSPAHLPGYAVHLKEGATFPFISPEPMEHAAGVVLSGLSPQEVARVDFYEIYAGFTLEEAEVVTADGGTMRVGVYLPDDPKMARGPRFDVADWAARWGDMVVETAAEYMAHFGRPDAAKAGALYDHFLARGAVRVRAKTAPPPAFRRDLAAEDVETQALDGGYAGFFRMDRFAIRHRRFDGQMSGRFEREVFVAFDAALLLPYDPVTDQVLIVEQLRFGPLARGDRRASVLEPIAGLVDAGETPQAAAEREAMEETGLRLREIRAMYEGYSSPGYSSEYFYCFLGLCDLSAYTPGIGGHDGENEDIRGHVLSFDEAMALVDTGEINAIPLIGMLTWLAGRRDGLRGAA